MEKSAREFADWKKQRDRELLQLKKQVGARAAGSWGFWKGAGRPFSILKHALSTAIQHPSPALPPPTHRIATARAA